MAEEGTGAGGAMDVNTVLQEVLKTTLIRNGLAHGICKAAKFKLVEALHAKHQINLIKVDDSKELGEWVGLCKTDREGKPCKAAGCSC
ncbi:hypothetical protein EI555_016708, partial [Monodon monoceros]